MHSLPGRSRRSKIVSHSKSSFWSYILSFPEPFTLRFRIRSRQAASLLAGFSDEIEWLWKQHGSFLWDNFNWLSQVPLCIIPLQDRILIYNLTGMLSSSCKRISSHSLPGHGTANIGKLASLRRAPHITNPLNRHLSAFLSQRGSSLTYQTAPIHGVHNPLRTYGYLFRHLACHIYQN